MVAGDEAALVLAGHPCLPPYPQHLWGSRWQRYRIDDHTRSYHRVHSSSEASVLYPKESSTRMFGPKSKVEDRRQWHGVL